MTNKSPYILGLTGGLASGKSTVSGFFKEAGATVVDADAIVHQLQAAGTPETKIIAEHFAEHTGKDVLDATGAIDREKLAQIVSANKELLSFLEGVLHPAVHREEKKQIQVAAEVGQALVVLDAPLLFEAGSDKHCDSVALCDAPPEVRKQRAMARSGMTEKKWQTLNARRWPEEKAKAAADYVIKTDTNEEQTRREVETLYQSLVNTQGHAFRKFWC